MSETGQLHPGSPCCSPKAGGCSAGLKAAMAAPEGAYIAPQDEAKARNVGKAGEPRRRKGGRVVSLSAILKAVEREYDSRGEGR